MGGSSMGGVIALRLAEEYPKGLAGGIQCQSAAIQWSSGKANAHELAAPSNLAKLSPGLRIWLDWGTFEDGLTRANEKLTSTLTKMNRKYGSMTTDEGHTWTAWKNRMTQGLRYILGAALQANR
jgi:enterochelin esterase-like enzyme